MRGSWWKCGGCVCCKPVSHHHVLSLGVVKPKPLGRCERHMGGKGQRELQPDAAFVLGSPGWGKGGREGGKEGGREGRVRVCGRREEDLVGQGKGKRTKMRTKGLMWDST